MSCCGMPRTPLEQFAACLRDAKELTLNFPMYVLPMEKVLQMREVRPHQDLLCEGELNIFDPAKGKAMFVSHQWTTEQHPDPEGKQLKIFQQAMSNLLTGRAVAQPNAWAEMVFNIAGGSAEGFTPSKLIQTPLLVWYDYFCIPQYPVADLRSRSLSNNQFQDQRNAIASIPAYIDRCDFFVALCPLLKHATSPSALSSQSWEQRGWCRAEAVVRDLSVKNGLTLIIQSPQQMSLAVTCSMLKAPGDGQFTVPGDRKLVGELVKGVLQQKLHNALRDRDLPRYRFLLNHQSALLRKSGTTPASGLLDNGSVDISSGFETLAEDFLLQNGFAKVSDRDKSGWSPLLYAALGGKPDVVEALLLQRADPNDYINKAQNLVMFVKGYRALSICAVQKHNEAMRVLLRFRADPNKQDPTGAGPLFYVSDSDNVEGAKILLEAGANPSLRGIFETNAFDHACAMGANKILKEVLNVPPDADSRREAIAFAMTWGHGSPETVAVLLQMGCDKDGVMRHRNTLTKFFVRAMELKHCVAQTALTTLIYHSTNATPLMRSILSGSSTCAHSLLENKARVDLRNSKNQTAFDLAVKKHAPDSLLWDLWRRGAGDHASKASIAWWSANAPERFPVSIGDVSEMSVSPRAPISDVATDDEPSDDPMISTYF